MADADDFSGHSLRRGFTNWAVVEGWDTKALMEYVGWKSVQSAMRYLERGDPFARYRSLLASGGLNRYIENVRFYAEHTRSPDFIKALTQRHQDGLLAYVTIVVEAPRQHQATPNRAIQGYRQLVGKTPIR